MGGASPFGRRGSQRAGLLAVIATLVFLPVEAQAPIQTQLWSATLTTGSNTALPTWFG